MSEYVEHKTHMLAVGALVLERVEVMQDVVTALI